MIGPGLAWIAPLKITDINSCMAAVQPDTSTCLGSEQTTIRKEKPQEARLPPVSNTVFFFFLFFCFWTQRPPSATVFFPPSLSLWNQTISGALWCIIGAISTTHHTLSGAVAGQQQQRGTLLSLSLSISLALYPTNCFTLTGLAAITIVGVMGLANYSRSGLSRPSPAATREHRADVLILQNMAS